MRLLYLHRGYYPFLAGAEMMVYNVAREMQRRGHEVLIVCQSTGNTSEYQQISGVNVLAVSQAESALVEALLPWHPDLIHVVDAVWPEFVRLARDLARHFQVPLAITPASALSVWHEMAGTLDICRDADLICVLTQAERELFVARGIARERFAVIGQGPQLSGNPDATGFRQRYGITGPMVLFLGRKIAFKGYRHLLEATASVWARLPETCFVFIGPRCDEDCLEIFQRYADVRIIELDAVDDDEKYSALVASDLLCLPTSADVFPLVFVEAWACSRPVITSPFPGVEEIVQREQDGLIVQPTPDALATSILSLLENSERRLAMGRAGALRVKTQFNWHSVTDAIEIAYAQIKVREF